MPIWGVTMMGFLDKIEIIKIQIPDQVSLTDIQIDAILAYIKTAGTTPKTKTDVLFKI